MSKQPPPAPTASAVGPCPTVVKIVGRPGTGSLPSTIAPSDQPRFGFKGPLRQYFSQNRAVSQREGERGERTGKSKNVQTTPTRTYCKRNRPLPYCNQNCRTPRHWKFTQQHRTPQRCSDSQQIISASQSSLSDVICCRRVVGWHDGAG